MRNTIIYFLTTLFLLFVVESKMNVKTLRNDYNGQVSHHLPKKANRLNQTYEKISVQQAPDNVDSSYSLELAEDDFQSSDTLQTIAVFASVFSLVYIFGLKNKKRLKSSVEDFIFNGLHVKRFILIRSIRI